MLIGESCQRTTSFLADDPALRLVPYYHYIPIQTDYSDLYDALAFFMGAPNGISGHDAIAEKIGAQAREFSVRHWRFEDMQVYVSLDLVYGTYSERFYAIIRCIDFYLNMGEQCLRIER